MRTAPGQIATRLSRVGVWRRFERFSGEAVPQIVALLTAARPCASRPQTAHGGKRSHSVVLNRAALSKVDAELKEQAARRSGQTDHRSKTASCRPPAAGRS